ncbi:MAG: hypothetical protein C0483_19440 [Pirellula sp.]|nr:hypothetical protein [Pirellula sp.]
MTTQRRAILVLAVLVVATLLAAPAAMAQPPMFDPGEMVKRMDRNENGQIDPEEMEGRARYFLESIARDNNLDLSKPISTDKLRDIMRKRMQGGPGGSSGSSGGSSSNKAAPAPAVKTFGVSSSGATPTVLGFGADAGADNWDSLRAKYDPRVIEKVEESLKRYDRNQDGTLDAEEMKNGRWDSGHPLDHDKNRDGKVQRNELAERYKARYASGAYDRGGPGGSYGGYGGGPPGGFSGGFGGGPPGGFSGGYGGGPPSMASTSSGSSSRSYAPSSSGSTSSTTSSSSAKPSSSGSSGGSSSGSSSSGDDRTLKYAEGLLKQYDTNKDGILQRDEWSKMRSESQKADRDGNGLITKEELAAQLADYSKGRSSGSSSGSSGSGSSTTGYSYGSRSSSSGGTASSGTNSASKGTVKTYRFLAPAERLPSGLPDWFTRNDGNGDGQISMAEFATSWDDGRAAEFTRWDRNGDGLVTPKEALGSGK